MKAHRRISISGRRSGFSLTEMLVVIGVIILLLGILLPAVYQARVSAKVTRMRADLNSIAIALGEYRKDFGTYPPVTDAGSGAAVLAKSLSGGWSVMKAGVTVRVVKPYLDSDKFRADVQGLYDEQGRPILYMPARALGGNINVANGYLASGTGRYDADVIRPFFVRNGSSMPMGSETLADIPSQALMRMQVMLGDLDTNGGIDTAAGEHAKATGGFVLWAAGLDEVFGPVGSMGSVIINRSLAQACDDLIHAGD